MPAQANAKPRRKQGQGPGQGVVQDNARQSAVFSHWACSPWPPGTGRGFENAALGTRISAKRELRCSKQYGRKPGLGKNATLTRRLNGQPFAALGAPCIDHGTTTACLHANEKTVGAGTANFGRLISAFHGKTSRRPWLEEFVE